MHSDAPPGKGCQITCYPVKSSIERMFAVRAAGLFLHIPLHTDPFALRRVVGAMVASFEIYDWLLVRGRGTPSSDHLKPHVYPLGNPEADADSPLQCSVLAGEEGHTRRARDALGASDERPPLTGLRPAVVRSHRSAPGL